MFGGGGGGGGRFECLSFWFFAYGTIVMEQNVQWDAGD